jgi:hypothetical protein
MLVLNQTIIENVFFISSFKKYYLLFLSIFLAEPLLVLEVSGRFSLSRRGSEVIASIKKTLHA